jgi:hypothetical protein
MAGGEESSSSDYGALNVTRFLPTQSRSREELILQTYGEGNGPLEVGDDGTARSIFNDDGGDVQRWLRRRWCRWGVHLQVLNQHGRP